MKLQAVIETAESKYRDLQDQHFSANLPAKTLAFMSRAAELYRRQVAQGLDGNPQAARKARVFLREWFGRKIRLEPPTRAREILLLVIVELSLQSDV